MGPEMMITVGLSDGLELVRELGPSLSRTTAGYGTPRMEDAGSKEENKNERQ